MTGICTAVAIFLIALPASGQFGSLSTNSDGSLLYFTSALRQTGSAQPNYGKIFVADESGVQLLGVREITRTSMSSVVSTNGSVSNFYDLVGVDISSNGQSLSAIGLRECIGFTAGLCRYSDQTTVYDSQGTVLLEVDGHLSLSPNGKWGLTTALPLFAPDPRLTVVDLVTGQQYPLPGTFFPGRDWRQHDIADDGTAVVVAAQGLHIFRPSGQLETIRFQEPSPQSVVIDSAGRTVVWAQSGQAGIGAATLQRGFQPIVIPPVSRREFAPRISDDGKRVLVLSSAFGEDSAQVVMIDLANLNRHQVTNESDGIRSAVLSGNGEIAWALTRTGRILRIEIDTAKVRTVTGPVAAFLANPGGEALALGQIVRLTASVLASDSLQVEIDGVPYTPVRVEDQWVSFQVPWDLSPAVNHELSLRPLQDSGWNGTSATLRAFAFAPRFSAKPMHEDNATEVVRDNPAKPGELLHLYAIGLGPASITLPIGSPAPDSPPIPTANPVICSIGVTYDSQAAIEVVFAGLAPGRVGIYQLDLRLPESFPANDGELVLSCQIPADEGGFPFTTLLPVSR